MSEFDTSDQEIRFLDGLPKYYQQDIDRATVILKEAGCTAIYLFGSLYEGTYHEYSDIDIAVQGLSPQLFFSIHGAIIFNCNNWIDLIDLDAPSGISNYLIKNKDRAMVRVA